MIFLRNDYSLGCHPDVLKALTDTNMELTVGYGLDDFCASAADKIKTIIDCPSADVHFLMGGTQTNLTCMSAFLRPHHSIISADTGHICVHETGAIEATGHKVNHMPTPDGKLRPADIEAAVAYHEDEHFVKPRIVYISNTTETGLVYTKSELYALREACDKHGLLLYMDGARLAMALTSPVTDFDFTDLPKIADAFYIGGTKCGAMFGEALVIVNDSLKEDMRFLIKQHGGLLAKGRLLGVQFGTLMSDNRYITWGTHANTMAKKLADAITAKGYEFYIKPESNQIFPIFPKELVAELEQKVSFEKWQYSTETHECIRLVASWGTTEEEVNAFLELI